jgi:pimeloyl-ACP methyl ester carboxylesterase
MNRRFFPLALAVVWVVQGAAGQAPAPRVVDLTAPDGTTLKATYFAASQPGPGVMLFHQCNRDRKMWEERAPRLVAAALNVLTLDFRGYGDSGGTAKFKVPPEEGRRLVTEVWPRRGEPCGSRGATSGAGVLQLRVAQARRGPHSAQDDNSVCYVPHDFIPE